MDLEIAAQAEETSIAGKQDRKYHESGKEMTSYDSKQRVCMACMPIQNLLSFILMA
jgi:hypothetical protein